MFKANPKYLEDMIVKFFPRVMNIYESNNELLFKYLNLICLEKMLYFSSQEIIAKIIDCQKLSFYVQRTIRSSDMLIVSITLQIIDHVVLKIPRIVDNFYREGVIDQLSSLKDSGELEHLKLNYLASNQVRSTYSFLGDQSGL